MSDYRPSCCLTTQHENRDGSASWNRSRVWLARVALRVVRLTLCAICTNLRRQHRQSRRTLRNSISPVGAWTGGVKEQLGLGRYDPDGDAANRWDIIAPIIVTCQDKGKGAQIVNIPFPIKGGVIPTKIAVPNHVGVEVGVFVGIGVGVEGV